MSETPAEPAAGDGEPRTDADEPRTDADDADRSRNHLTIAGMAALFLATILGGLALAGPFTEAGLQQFEDPSNPGNAGLIVVEVLVFTAIFLLALRYDRGPQVIRVLVLVAFAFMFQFPARVLLPPSAPAGVAIAIGVAGAVLLWIHPEWYVLDAAGVVGGAVIVGLFGVSLSVLPVLALLATLAVYDAYSVYVSEHMQSLAGGVLELKVPMVFVVPERLDFSMRDADDLESAAEEAMFLGVGDAAIPGLLAVSADAFVDAPDVIAGLNAPALGATVGAAAGLGLLFVLLFRIRRTHAGLPALNGSVIAGYLVGALAAGVGPADALGIGPYL